MPRFHSILTLTRSEHVRLKTFFILFNFVCNQKMTPGPFCVFVCARNGYSFRGWLYNQCLNEFTFRICLILRSERVHFTMPFFLLGMAFHKFVSSGLVYGCHCKAGMKSLTRESGGYPNKM